jgi:pyroglutamyl-peptidase
VTYTILLTGFGPFPTAPINPTAALVKKLAARRRPAFAHLERVAHVFPTSYAVVDKELPRLLGGTRPGALVMFGLATRTPYLRIETRARNVLSALFPDADAKLGTATRIRAGAAVTITGRAPFQKIRTAARAARVPVKLSHNAGTYLCNYLYWQALEMTRSDDVPLVVFVHVPKLRSNNGPRGRAKRRGLSARDLERAGEAMLFAIAPELRRSRCRR